MADPERDHGFVITANGRTRIDLDSSSFLDVGFGDDLTVEDYLDRVSLVIGTEIEISLGINHRHQKLHPEDPVHPAYRAFRLPPVGLTDRDHSAAAPVFEEPLVPPVGNLKSIWILGLLLPALVVTFLTLLAHYILFCKA